MQNEKTSDPAPPVQSAPAAPLTFDAGDYVGELNEFDLSDEQKQELLQILWHIMSTFVDIGWGVDTVQLFLPEIFGNVSQDPNNGGNDE